MTTAKNPLPVKADSHTPFYGWLLLFGLMLFGAFLLWWHKLWHIVLTQDQTYLSGIIVVLFLLTTLYLGRCAWRVSQEQRFAEALLGDSSKARELNSWASDYLQLLAQSQKHVDGSSRFAHEHSALQL